jgi:hypothetical protein
MEEKIWRLRATDGGFEAPPSTSEAGLLQALHTRFRLSFDQDLEVIFPDGTTLSGPALENWYHARKHTVG